MTGVAEQYGQALYELARDEKLSDPILKQLQALTESFRTEPDFLRLLASHNLSKDERCALVDVSFQGSVHPYLLNFLKILTQEGIARKFPDCCKHFERLYYADHDILPVLVYSAQPLTPTQTDLLTEKLAAITGKTVRLEGRLDPDCLGGVRICYDGKQVDDTVKNRLEAVGKLLKNTVL